MRLSLAAGRIGTILLAGIVPFVSTPASADSGYPPTVDPQSSVQVPTTPAVGGLIFTNTHTYAFGGNPAAVRIRVEVYDNFGGDFSKYRWVYIVTNNTYDPVPGSSNGFSGFELTLPQFVPDIGNITAPDGIPPWLINCCSGLPVEWDLTNSGGAIVGGGTMPGQTEVYSFTTAPRLVTISNGWFHTWRNNSQTTIVSYPPGDGPEVPDVLAPPNLELCCHQQGTVCETRPAGECATLGGFVVPNCTQCINTPANRPTWGDVKVRYR